MRLSMRPHAHTAILFTFLLITGSVFTAYADHIRVKENTLTSTSFDCDFDQSSGPVLLLTVDPISDSPSAIGFREWNNRGFIAIMGKTDFGEAKHNWPWQIRQSIFDKSRTSSDFRYSTASEIDMVEKTTFVNLDEDLAFAWEPKHGITIYGTMLFLFGSAIVGIVARRTRKRGRYAHKKRRYHFTNRRLPGS
jgi:hypothetical protein